MTIWNRGIAKSNLAILNYGIPQSWKFDDNSMVQWWWGCRLWCGQALTKFSIPVILGFFFQTSFFHWHRLIASFHWINLSNLIVCKWSHQIVRRMKRLRFTYQLWCSCLEKGGTYYLIHFVAFCILQSYHMLLNIFNKKSEGSRWQIWYSCYS